MGPDRSSPLPIFRWDASIPYAETAQRQEKQVAQNQECLIFCEHPPTITLGTGAEWSDLACSPVYYERMGLCVHKSPRGGKATYHGPGQLVCYPILNLRDREFTIHAYLRFLEDLMLHLCASYGIQACRREGKAGAWVEERKIGFIGVRVRRGFAFHGCSLNVAPQQEAFRLIVPCGMPNLPVTSIQEETGLSLSVWDVADKMEVIFLTLLNTYSLEAPLVCT